VARERQTWHAWVAYYYGVFWSVMARPNFRTPRVRAEAERIARSGLGRAVAGFRLTHPPLSRDRPRRTWAERHYETH